MLQVQDHYEIVGVFDERAEVALARAHLLLGLALPDRKAQDIGDRLEEIHLVMAELARLRVVDGEYAEGMFAAVDYHRHAALQLPAFSDQTAQALLAAEVGHDHRRVNQHRVAGIRASANLRHDRAHHVRFPSGASLADQRLAVRSQRHHGGIRSLQCFAHQAGGFVEQLLQSAAEQRVLAQRCDDRLLKSIIVARIAGVFYVLVDHRRIARVQ